MWDANHSFANHSLLRPSVLGSVLAACCLMATVAVAAPDTGACVQGKHADAIALWDSPNDTEGGRLGDAISDGFFGNEPNLPNSSDDYGPEEVVPGSGAGSVVPSQSPGPKINGGGFTTLGSLVSPGANDCAIVP